MKKKIIVLFCAALGLLWGAGALPVQSAPPLIRLHVLAESDSAEHQAQKLIVRDAVLASAQQMLSDCADHTQAYSILDERISEIEAAAQSVSEAPVHAALGREHYPDRDYGAFTLPEGDYLSLRVMIGEGAGQNWWCVVYPGLCTPGGDTVDALTGLTETQPLRSAVWEWLRCRLDDIPAFREVFGRV